MTDLLIRLFIRHPDTVKDPLTRRAYGTMVSVVGIVLNVLLFAGKFTVGFLFGAISIQADAINNLSDAGSQVVSLVSFKISAKPADRGHPFGHARVEYIASMIVSFVILVIGYQLFRDSIEKIIAGEVPEFSWLMIVVLIVSIAVKLWMFIFNRKVGKKIDSSVMRATSTDSLSDVLATTAVLVATLLFHFFNWNIDAWMGIVVSVLIVVSGIGILNDAKNSLMGEAPSDEIVAGIRRIVAEYPDALGIHDLVVHNYGPGRMFATLHIEVDGSRDIFETHDMIDNIERKIAHELNIQTTIHMDPIETDDTAVTALREQVKSAVQALDTRYTIHDFRMVRGVTHSNLIFDVVLPFEVETPTKEIEKQIEAAVRSLDENYYAVINFDRG